MSRPASERPRILTIISHLGVMIAVSAVLGVVVSGLAIPFAGLVGFGAHQAADSVDQLPEELKTATLPQKTTIVDAQGDPIATIFDQNRVNVSLDQISPTMVQALLSIEDYRFYEHGALDLKGTLRAFVTNQAASGVVQGGSSITQQLVKLTLLGEANNARQRKAVTDDTYARKLKELRYAIALEKAHSKNWILERYLNTAYFGDGAYGVQAAAKHYFDVNAKDLDLNQSAILGGLVQNPSAFDPTNYPDRARTRRDVVLSRMAQLHVINKLRARKVEHSGLHLDPQPSNNGCVNSSAPFFCDYTISYLEHDKALGRTKEERKRLLYSGGLTIKTTIDLRYQKAADAAVKSHVYPKDNAIGAMAMVKPGTGEVKAIAQSRPMGADKSKGQSYLNYAVPTKYGDSAGFQPGSTFKLFVLAAAIEKGIPLTTQIASPESLTTPLRDFDTCDGPYPSSQVYTWHNSTGFGTPSFNLYTGTQQSINTFFIQLEQRTGLCKPFELAKAMGVDLTDRTNEEVPSFTLGVASVSPLEMAGAYATVAARGLHCDPRPVTEIDGPDGAVLKSYKPQCTQVMPSAVADAVNAVLKGVQDPGGFGYDAGISLNDRDDAGKTGTTSSNYTVWFDGYTPELATVAMVGGANSVGTPISLNNQSIGPSITYTAHGSTTAGPIWGDAMKAIAPLLPPTKFVVPDGTDISGVLLPVPAVAGESLDDAIADVTAAGFTPQVGGSVDSGYTAGEVAYTSPSGGSTLSSGDTVTLYQSDGTPYVPPSSHGRGRGRHGRR